MNPETCAEILMLVAVVLETLERLVIDERANGTMDSYTGVKPWLVGSTGSGSAPNSVYVGICTGGLFAGTIAGANFFQGEAVS